MKIWSHNFFNAIALLRRGDGVHRWHLVRAMPQRDEDDQIVKWFGTCTDIEEQRQLEQNLEQAEEEAEAASKAKSQFLANMSHELRTPLNAVIGYSEMLVEGLEADGASAETGEQKEQFLTDLDKIHDAGEQLLDLINDVWTSPGSRPARWNCTRRPRHDAR